jgi:hypothetical protein
VNKQEIGTTFQSGEPESEGPEQASCRLTQRRETTRFCKSLQTAIKGDYSPRCGSGMWLLVLGGYDEAAKDFTEQVRGVAYKPSRDDRGVLLNHCPWCGARLLDEVDHRPMHRELAPGECVGVTG